MVGSLSHRLLKCVDNPFNGSWCLLSLNVPQASVRVLAKPGHSVFGHVLICYFEFSRIELKPFKKVVLSERVLCEECSNALKECQDGGLVLPTLRGSKVKRDVKDGHTISILSSDPTLLGRGAKRTLTELVRLLHSLFLVP